MSIVVGPEINGVREHPYDSATVSVSDEVVALLEEVYVFRIRDDIQWFLDESPFLAPVLFEAHVYANYFFTYSQKLLSVVSDPEISNHFQLVVSILVNIDVDEAFRRLKAFDQKWWLEAKKQTKGLMTVTVEFE